MLAGALRWPRRSELVALEARKLEFDQITTKPREETALHPAMATEFRRKVEAFAAAVDSGEAPAEARSALRLVVAGIMIEPGDGV